MTNAFDFDNVQVQRELTGSSFVKGESTIIAAGPPFLRLYHDVGSGVDFSFRDSEDTFNSGNARGAASLGSIPIYPIGVIENANMGQARQLRRIAEIGSKRFHFVAGRTMSQLSLARVLFHGPSLLRVLYAYVSKDRFSQLHGGLDIEELLDADREYDSGLDTAQVHSIPGWADFFINLDSNLFDIPFGLMFYMEDSKGNPYGAFYCEEAYIQTHQFNVGASATVIAEGVSVQFDRAMPIQVNANPIAQV